MLNVYKKIFSKLSVLNKDKRQKEINIITFGKGFWGHNFYLDSVNKNENDAHGFYSGDFIFGTDSINKRILKKGSVVVKEGNNGGYWLARITKIEWKSDPSDMFFCKCRTIKSSKDLTSSEIEWLNENLFK